MSELAWKGVRLCDMPLIAHEAIIDALPLTMNPSVYSDIIVHLIHRRAKPLAQSDDVV